MQSVVDWLVNWWAQLQQSGLPPTWLQDLGAWGNFLAGIALPLAIWVLIRDRLAANRAQVDRLAAWIEPPSFAPFQRTPGQPVWVDVRVLIRNTSKLPLEIVHVGVKLRPSWVVTDHLQPDQVRNKAFPVHMPRETEASTFKFQVSRLAPGATHKQAHKIDVGDSAPARSLGISPDRGIVCEFRSVLVIDNAGRRWRLQPGRAGSAERVRRGRKRKDEYEPQHW